MRRLPLAVALLALLPIAATSPAAGAAEPCRVGGAIGQYWTSIGGERSFLGPCVTDETAVRDGVRQDFRGGSVYWSHRTQARSIHGSIRAAYDAVGGAASRLGLPATHETPTPHRAGAFNHFVDGSIYWSPATGAHAVVGAIRQTWQRLGWENGSLGFPVTGETASSGGAFGDFQGGTVAWSPSTGPHVVKGSIRQRWRALGGERGTLGFPTTSELLTPIKAGAYSHFSGGSVYWSPATGAYAVTGAIRDRWAAMGWENSALGFPVSDAYAVAGGTRSDFAGGSITQDARTGQTSVQPGPRASFTFTVAPVTAADLPSSYRAGCPVPPQDLRLLRMSFVDFGAAERTGELVIHSDQVTQVLRAFARIHEARFPIARMDKVDAFGGSDDASMDANNTSAFNCRRSTGGSTWSEHAYGRAIDINPVQNPYVSGSTVLPEAGRAFLDRGDRRPGMIAAGDAVVQGFAAEGWQWGGFWTNPRDYQHLSATGR